MPGRPHVYTRPAQLPLNQWALSGDWTMAEEATTLNTADGEIACRFHGRDLNLVMGPAVPGTSRAIPRPASTGSPQWAHGSDVDGEGAAPSRQRVYQLIRQPGPITDHTFEITFPDPGAQAYSFTFG